MPNSDSDAIIAAAKNVVLNGRTVGPEIQAMMDLISGIPNYSMASNTNQGWIHRKLMRDRIEHNHIIDIDVLISWFWTGVMKALHKVEAAGTSVLVYHDIVAEQSGAPHMRATSMSPLNYLRQHGFFMAKMYINKVFKERLRQHCLDCDRISLVGSTREYDTGCPFCGSTDSFLNQIFASKRTRTCNQCHKVRTTRFERVCGKPHLVNDRIEFVDGCGSENVVLVTIEEYNTDDTDKHTKVIYWHDSTPEDLLADAEIDHEVIDFIKACEIALPADPKDPKGDSRNRQILRILVDPQEGRDICSRCRERAGVICAVQCGNPGCSHTKIVNPKESCGAEHFSLPMCINYSRKIGEYLGCTSTLINMRVKRIRQHTLSFALHNTRRFSVARYLVSRLTPKKDEHEPAH